MKGSSARQQNTHNYKQSLGEILGDGQGTNSADENNF